MTCDVGGGMAADESLKLGMTLFMKLRNVLSWLFTVSLLTYVFKLFMFESFWKSSVWFVTLSTGWDRYEWPMRWLLGALWWGLVGVPLPDSDGDNDSRPVVVILLCRL